MAKECPKKSECMCLDEYCCEECFEKSKHHCFVQKREVSDK